MAEGETVDPRVALVESLWADPEIRQGYLEPAIAKKFPDKAPGVMPGYAARVEGEKIRGELRTELDGIRKERETERTAQWVAKQKQAIMDDPELRIREEEIPEVEKLMQDPENLVGTYKAGARLYRAAQKSIGGNRSSSFNTMTVPGLRGAGGDLYKGILEDREGWARNLTEQIMQDHANGRLDRWQ